MSHLFWAKVTIGTAMALALVVAYAGIMLIVLNLKSKRSAADPWTSVDDDLPEGSFIGLNQRQGNMVCAWWDPVHKRYLYTGGEYYGNKEHPRFTHWMPRPELPMSRAIVMSK